MLTDKEAPHKNQTCHAEFHLERDIVTTFTRSIDKLLCQQSVKYLTVIDINHICSGKKTLAVEAAKCMNRFECGAPFSGQ